MKPKLIRLKYAGTCRGCGRSLSVGAQAYWAQGEGAACTSCGASAFSRSRLAPATPASTSRGAASGARSGVGSRSAALRSGNVGPVPDDQAKWTAYCDYLLVCVAAEAQESGSFLESGGQWAALDVNPIRDTSLSVTVPSDMSAEARAGSLSLRLGWPVLALAEQDGRHRLVPLLVLDVDVSAEATPKLVPLDDRPAVNPDLTRAGMDDSDVALLEHLLRDGAEEPIEAVLERMAESLGMAAPKRGELPESPRPNSGLQNVVLLEKLEGTAYTRSLQRELTALRERTDWPGTAAGALLRGTSSAMAAPPSVVSAPVPVNDSQIDAVLSSSEQVTVVTGPPGTGKSQVVASLAGTSWFQGNSFLVTSTNNAAVDVAVARLQDVHPVLTLRSGNKEARQKLAVTAGELLRLQAGPGPVAAERKELTLAYGALADLRERSTARSLAQERLLRAVMVLEEATEGVLLDQHEQPESSARDAVRRIERLTRKEPMSWWRRRRIRKLLRALGIRESSAPKAIHGWAQAWLETTDATAHLRSLGPLESADAVDSVVAQWRSASVKVLQLQAAYALQAGKPALKRLADDRPRPGGRPLLDAADLKVLPGWAVTALSVAGTLPLQAGVVDLLILDEASQCSLAHVLPLAYRAKRSVVLGDPNQLKPVVRLTPQEEARAASSAGLDTGTLADSSLSFRESSAFDAFARCVDSVHLLDEHYRCHPEIAGWFNREFYSGSLTVLSRVDPLARRGVEHHRVDGRSERPLGGSWINPLEAERIYDLVVELADDGVSVGVVTPFAAQARHIRRGLTERHGEAWMTEHDVAVATAHRFQGGERDVVLFSTVVTPGTPASSARWVETNRNLINVGASRAKRLLVVVGHPEAPGAHDLPTLGSLWAASITTEDDVDLEGALTESERRFWRAFDEGLGFLAPRQRIEGYDVDFAWTAPWGMNVDIEIDDDIVGGPPRSRRRDIERDRVLNRVGWQVVRVPGWYCYAHADAVVESLKDTLTVLEEPTSATVELMPWVGR